VRKTLPRVKKIGKIHGKFPSPVEPNRLTCVATGIGVRVGGTVDIVVRTLHQCFLTFVPQRSLRGSMKVILLM